uniref:Uncharacterized protein n=1 Tax=Aegilops tauschii subsp. strangulata TaxID=200361 RepID=A0A453BVD2_AEGTS
MTAVKQEEVDTTSDTSGDQLPMVILKNILMIDQSFFITYACKLINYVIKQILSGSSRCSVCYSLML